MLFAEALSERYSGEPYIGQDGLAFQPLGTVEEK